MANKRIVLTGGGTAGHVMPNIALIPRLKELGYEIHYIGGSAVERELIQAVPGVTFHRISTGKLRRYFSFKNFTDPFRILRGVCRSPRHHFAHQTERRLFQGRVRGRPGRNGARLKRAHHPARVGHVRRPRQPYQRALSDVVCTSFEPTAAKIKAQGRLHRHADPRRTPKMTRRPLCACSGLEDPNKPVLLCMGGSQWALSP